ncbi:hypothetical protein J2X14_002618 [Pantoea alhagi]|uniref:hypothetical protein n=1 Tax=Mixta sp. BE291 TaxID=3158787 RepID=UPI0028565F89|nr:hypothetical protein [Pantoea alhagi]
MAVVADKTSSPVLASDEWVRIGQWSTLLRELLKGKGEMWSAADEKLFIQLQSALLAMDNNDVASIESVTPETY